MTDFLASIQPFLYVVGVMLVFVGVVFSALGVLGILRLPDTYSRLHATGKTGTLGVLVICLGVACIMPGAAFKLFALGVFLIFSNPLTSHAIAAAVHRAEEQNPEAEAPVQTQETPSVS